MTSNANDIRDALIEAISDSEELRRIIDSVPERVAATVASFVPVDKGTAKASIEVKGRRTPWRRLSTRRIKVGTVDSDDDHAKIATLEYGRGADAEHGETPEFAMFRKAAAVWNDARL